MQLESHLPVAVWMASWAWPTMQFAGSSVALPLQNLGSPGSTFAGASGGQAASVRSLTHDLPTRSPHGRIQYVPVWTPAVGGVADPLERSATHL